MKEEEIEALKNLGGESAAPLLFTEGPARASLSDSSIINAWSITFLITVSMIIGLSIYSPDPYLEVLLFIPDGVMVTFKITLMSICFAVPLGLVTGLGRLSKNKFINLIASTYVEVIRGIPLLMQLFYIHYALPKILPSLTLPPAVSAVIALSFCYGAYMGEVFRAGILSIPKGQMEAARSLGFTRTQAMFLIVLPQAMRMIIPPIGNECIALLKDTSLVSIIAVADLLRRGREYASQTFEYFEVYTMIALVYLLITLLLSKGMSLLEGRMSNYDKR